MENLAWIGIVIFWFFNFKLQQLPIAIFVKTCIFFLANLREIERKTSLNFFQVFIKYTTFQLFMKRSYQVQNHLFHHKYG